MQVLGKTDQENGPKAERRDKTEIATGLGRRTRQEIYKKKYDQTGSPGIPDRGGDIRNGRGA